MRRSNSGKKRRRLSRKFLKLTREFVSPLEPRLLFSSNVIATFDGAISPTSTSNAWTIHLTPSDFAYTGGLETLGFHVVPTGTSAINPALVGIVNSAAQTVAPLAVNANIANHTQSLVLAQLAQGDYTVTVSAAGGTTGAYELQVFLAGDVNGDRAVNASDSTLIQSAYGSLTGQPKYNAAADMNLDGAVNSVDLAVWTKAHLDSTDISPFGLTGALASPSPITTLPDGSVLINSHTATISGITGPGVTVKLDDNGDNYASGSTIAAADGTYSITATLAEGANNLTIKASDRFGQVHTTTLAITTDTVGPSLTATLAHDTGSSSSDRITSDPSVTGTATDPVGITTFTAGFDSTNVSSYSDISADLSSGVFSLDSTDIAIINGASPLADGPHVLHLMATDTGSQTRTYNLSFTLKTSAIAPAFALSPASQSQSLGDHKTTLSAVTLNGSTEPNATVTLSNGATTNSNGAGAFSFSNISLGSGSNSFTASVTDVAGNAAKSNQIIFQVPLVQSAGQVALSWDAAAVAAIQADASTPEFASRMLAIMSAATYDAGNSVDDATSFLFVHAASPAGASDVAAVAQAAYTVLSYLYPAQQANFATLLASSLASVTDPTAKSAGIAVGQQVAGTILQMRAKDGYLNFTEYTPGSGNGVWVPTYPSYMPAENPQWATLKPFLMTSDSQFRSAGPPDLSSAQWEADYNQVMSLGAVNSTTRTADETQIARFWNDPTGTATPPGHWNVIASTVAAAKNLSLSDTTRMLAQLNVALADAAIVAWDDKYTYNFWRPITAIPVGGGNSDLTADPNWYPLLTTPPFSEYVSGHSTFSGAAAAVLDNFFGPNTPFTIGSSSPGMAGVMRSYTGFDQAAREAAISRVYAGIHFLTSVNDGLTAGTALGNYIIQKFADLSDTTPPVVTFMNTQNQAVKSNVPITGQATDNLSGLATLTGQFDNGSIFAVSVDSSGNFSVTPTFALNDSADGTHVLHLVATDQAGNVSSSYDYTFTLDTAAPTIAVTSPALGAGESGPISLSAGATLTGTCDGTGSVLVALSYQFDSGMTMPLSFGDDGSFSQAVDLSKLSSGDHTLAITATDAAGNVTTTTLSVTLPSMIPLTVSSFTPTTGSSDVGATYRPEVFFSRPINTATLNSSDFYLTDSTGSTVPTTIVPSSDGTYAWLFPTSAMPGASTMTVTVDGSQIKAADGSFLDAAGNGSTTGSLLTFNFTTVSTASLTGTSLSGIVADPGADLKPGTMDDVSNGADGVLGTADDVYKLPIRGVTVSIVGTNLTTTTDANGYFSFPSIPAGDIKLDVDGTTATNPPAGYYFPTMTMDLQIQQGVANTVMKAMQMSGTGNSTPGQQLPTAPGVYLPRVASSILQTIAPDSGMTQVGINAQAAPDLTPEQADMLKIDVPAGVAIGTDGQPMSSFQIGVSTVPPSLVMDMLPPGELQHSFDITVQAPGVTVFTQPLAMSFPNLFDAAPGTKVNFLSYDHTTGRLEIQGTATVSADGLSIHTDPGTGITHPGWHFVIQGSPAKFEVGSKEGNSLDPGIGKGEDFDMSDHSYQNLDQQFNDLVSGIPNLISKIPGLGSFALPSLSPFETTLEAIAKAGVIAGSIAKGGNLSIVNRYYNAFFDGSQFGPVTAAPDILNMVKSDHNVQDNLDDLTTDVQGLVTDAIDAELADGNGVLDLNNVRDRVENGLAGLDGYNLPTLRSTGTLLLVIDGTQKATVEIDGLQASGSIIDPEVGGFGTWSAKLTYTLSDDFGFDTHDVSRTLDMAHTQLANAGNSLANAVYDETVAENSLAKLDFSTALAAAQAEFADLKAVGAAAFSAGEDYAGGNLVDLFRDLQLHGNARPYTTVFPVDTDISGTFSIPAGFGDVVIIPDPPDVPGDVGASGMIPVSTVPGFGSSSNIYYRLALDNGFEIAGVEGDGGSVNDLVLAPHEHLVATFYAPSSNSSLRLSGVTSASGTPTLVGQAPFDMSGNIGFLQMTTFGGPDKDSDGIPDIGEYVLGTDPNKADTNGDGIDDGAELADGLNPLRSGDLPTGVVGSLPLQGVAEAVDVEGGVSSGNQTAVNQTAYVATGPYGFAIVNASQFNQPKILSQLQLPGGNATDVAVDPNLQIAAVAENAGGLVLVNVANPLAPTITYTIAAARANLVRVDEGIAYAAVGGSLEAIDLETGELLQTLHLSTGTITGLAREGSTLYTIDSNHILRAIDISSMVMAAEGSLAIPAATGKIFVGNGIAYIAAVPHGDPNQGGFATANVSDPNNLTLIAGPSSTTLAGLSVHANGSGLGVSVGSFVGYGGVLDVSDVSDPSKTNQFLTRYSLPAAPFDLAIASGIAFVADGTGGLQVVSYEPFDNKGVAPTVSITTSAADLDPATPGLQMLEGSTLPITVSANDDVQVRDVQLLVNGMAVQDAVSFPFDLATILPSIAKSGSSTVTVQVLATDTGGNVGASNVLTIELATDAPPPTITSLSPDNGSSSLEGQQAVRIGFSKALDPTTVTTSTFQLMDANGNLVTAKNIELQNNNQLVQLAFPSLQAGQYQLVINGAAVTSTAGVALGAGNITEAFTLTPRETLTIANADADPNTPGLQLYEASTITGTVAVDSSVAVKSINLLVNGNVVSTSFTAPFNYSYIAPLLSSGASSITLQARVTDVNGVVTITPPVVVGLLRDTTPPMLTSIIPVNNSVQSPNFHTITLNFSEPINESTAVAGNFNLTGPGGVTLSPTSIQFSSDDSQIQLTYAPLVAGNWTFSISAPAITDRAGNALDTTNVTTNFAIQQSYSDVWASPAGGFWDVASNWSTGVVPRATDDVLIPSSIAGSITYRSLSGTTTVRSLNLQAPLSITGGTLDVTQDLDASANITMAGGTLQDAAVNLSGGAAVLASSSGGTLNNVTVNGDLMLSDPSARLIIAGSTSFANAHLSGASSAIGFAPGYVLSGNLLFEGSNTGGRFVEMNGSSGTLTIGPTGSIQTVMGFAGTGSIGTNSVFGGTMTLVNNGIISETNATLNLGGTLSQASLGTFSRTGGTVNLTGTLSGGLALDATTGSWILNGGTLSGGTVTATGGAQLLVTSGTLSGVTLATNLSIPNSKSLTIANGLTLSGGATVSLNSTGSTTSLQMSPGTQTIGGTGQILFGGSSSNNQMALNGLTFQSPQTYNVSSGGFSSNAFAVADVNGDGKVDLVTAFANQFIGSALQVSLGKGDGTFAGGGFYLISGTTFPTAVAVADVNGDGRPDIISVDANGLVNELLGDAFGSFTAQPSFLTASGATSIAVADLNGDGKRDIVIANGYSGTVSVLLGNGNGTFQTQQIIGVSTNPSSVALADVNGDGKMDLVLGGANGFGFGFVTVALGNGNGTFQSQQNISVTPSTSLSYSVKVADLNGDGKPDIVMSNGNASSVSVLMGNGDGTYKSPQTISVGSSPSAVAVADVNGDGKLDIVTANSGSSNASLLLGNGDGTFRSQLAFAVGGSPSSIALADLNGDGNPDIVTALGSFSEASVLLNIWQPAAVTLGPNVTVHGLGTIQPAGDATLINNGTIQADVSGQTLNVSNVSLTNNGTLSATGGGTLSLSNLAANSGTIAAGVSSVVAVNGNLTNSPSGTLSIAIGGTSPSQFGQINITGAANLAGTLALQLANGFNPAVAKLFQVMNYGSSSGEFGQLTGTAAGNGLQFTTQYEATNLTLVTILNPGGPIVGTELDSTFGTNGVAKFSFVGATAQNDIDMAQLPNGEILVAGDAVVSAALGGQNFALAKYHTDGSLDTTFGVNGTVTTDFFGGVDTGEMMAVQPDGKILLAGSDVDSAANGGQNWAIARYNPNGTLDTTFGNGTGKVTTHVPAVNGSDAAFSITLSTTFPGKFYVAGQMASGTSTGSDFGVARYNSDGSLDTTFGSGTGLVLVPMTTSTDRVFQVQELPDGRILLAGDVTSTVALGNRNVGLARLNSNGTLDTTFGGSGTGMAIYDFSGTLDSCRSMALLPDGRFVITGDIGQTVASTSSGPFDIMVARFNSNGTFDTTFGAGTGWVRTDCGGSEGPGAIAVQADGKYVVAGSGPIEAVRYNTDGTLDSTFGVDGMVSGSPATGLAVVIQPDGKILAAGGGSVVRYLAATAYSTYGTSVNTPLVVSSPSAGVLSVASDVDGDTLHAIRVSGPSHGTLTLNPDGTFSYTPDTNFVGIDTFTFKANDGQTDSNVAPVTINVTP